MECFNGKIKYDCVLISAQNGLKLTVIKQNIFIFVRYLLENYSSCITLAENYLLDCRKYRWSWLLF